MYYEAIKSAFRLFPQDPPGKLQPGDYVRIGKNGQTRHYGTLGTLLKLPIEVEQVSHSVEYMSEGVTKSGLLGTVEGVAEAKVSFSSRPGVYIKGKRTALRIRNLQPVLHSLARAAVDWSIWFRIVVEAQVVEHADIVCSTETAGNANVAYDQAGMPVKVNADYGSQLRGLLHLPDVSGTLAFGAIRFIRGLGALGANPLEPFQFRHLDVDDPEDVEASIDDE